MATANLLQTSVSGGTQNALSLQGDGVFFPKASTTSRLALTLTTTDKGFIVYDTTDNNIYFWNGAAWESVPSSGDAGANGSVQYNDNGIVSGATNFVWDKVNGRVGIGTASPSNQLHVKSTTSTPALIETSGGALTYLQFTSTTGSAYVGNNANGLGFYTTGSADLRMSLTAAGDLSITSGNVVMATSGKGIDFSATPGTGTSELLNDYEEGTFLPVVEGTSTAGSATYSTQIARYTKVGRLVTFSLRVIYTGGTGIGNLRVAGLPFTTGFGANYAIYSENIALTAGYIAVSSSASSVTSIGIDQIPTGGGGALGVPYDAAGDIQISGSYTV